jgi:hypothetical protein
MCIIAHVIINGNIYLAKNRDRYYITPIKLIRQIINNVEILYLLDVKSGWIEGINQYGISIINSVLPVTREEAILKTSSSKRNSGILNKAGLSNDGDIILKALSQTRLEDAISILMECSCNKSRGLYGHTIITNGIYSIVIEYTEKTYPILKYIKSRCIRTNHTIYHDYTKGGYNPHTNNISYQSSVIRRNLSKKLLRNIKKKEDILSKLSNIDTINPCNSVYRIGHRCDYQFKYGFATTSQVVFDIKNLHMLLKLDPFNSNFIGYFDLTQTNPKTHKITYCRPSTDRISYPKTTLKEN